MRSLFLFFTGASQTKLLKILPKVIRNIKKLIRCKNIPPNVILELKESCQLLDPNVEGLNDTASMTGSSRPVTAAASRPLTAVPTTGKKEKKASFVPLIDPTRLINIREGQRRIAALLFVSNLPTSMIKFLSTVEVAMQDQTAANVLVDDVVHEECELLLKLRYKEQQILKIKTRIMLLTQNETIKKGNNELFILFTKLTKILENHRAKANIVDCNMDHILAVMHDESEVSI